MANADLLLEMRSIDKSFPGVHALRQVDFELHTGEIHALVGENGAGKSTLVNILAGVCHRDRGDIRLRGRPVGIATPAQAQSLGISFIPQELTLVPQLSVGENMYMGRLPRGRFGLVDWKALYEQAAHVLNNLDVDLSPAQLVGQLSVAEQQLVAISKALSMDAQFVIMDEPTSSISRRETERLFELVLRLKERGVSVIYISHLLEEIFAVADTVSVLRDGQLISTLPVSQAKMDQIISMMVGRDVSNTYPKVEATIAEPVLEVRNLSRKGVVRDVSFTLHRGEIVGLTGLIGAGRTELARLIYGIDHKDRGEILIDGVPVHIPSPAHAVRLGIGFAPEDRKKQGLVLGMSVLKNISLAVLPRLLRLGLIDRKQERALAETYRKRLDIRASSLGQRVLTLSGGNQQKVVIAKWLATDSRVLILDEPTRGIDVGAKAEIRALMSELAGRGVGILLISSDLPEVMGMSDRVLVMRQGRLVGDFPRDRASAKQIMHCAVGRANDNSAAIAGA